MVEVGRSGLVSVLLREVFGYPVVGQERGVVVERRGDEMRCG